MTKQGRKAIEHFLGELIRGAKEHCMDEIPVELLEFMIETEVWNEGLYKDDPEAVKECKVK